MWSVRVRVPSGSIHDRNESAHLSRSAMGANCSCMAGTSPETTTSEVQLEVGLAPASAPEAMGGVADPDHAIVTAMASPQPASDQASQAPPVLDAALATSVAPAAGPEAMRFGPRMPMPDRRLSCTRATQYSKGLAQFNRSLTTGLRSRGQRSPVTIQKANLPCLTI